MAVVRRLGAAWMAFSSSVGCFRDGFGTGAEVAVDSFSSSQP
jgi:hypothetical protein